MEALLNAERLRGMRHSQFGVTGGRLALYLTDSLDVSSWTTGISSDVSYVSNDPKFELKSPPGSDMNGKGESPSTRACSVGSRSRELAEMSGIVHPTTSVSGKSAGTIRAATEKVGGREITIGFKVAPWSRVGAEGEAGSPMVDGVVLALTVVTDVSLDGGHFYIRTVVAFGMDSFAK